MYNHNSQDYILDLFTAQIILKQARNLFSILKKKSECLSFWSKQV